MKPNFRMSVHSSREMLKGISQLVVMRSRECRDRYVRILDRWCLVHSVSVETWPIPYRYRTDVTVGTDRRYDSRHGLHRWDGLGGWCPALQPDCSEIDWRYVQDRDPCVYVSSYYCLTYTGFRGGLEQLKIETRLRDERFESVTRRVSVWSRIYRRSINIQIDT